MLLPFQQFYRLITALAVCLSLIIFSANDKAFAQINEAELFFVAQKAFEDGFYDIAVRYIEQFTQQYPQSAKQIQAKLLLGQCYFFQNQYLKAYEIFQSLVNAAEFQDATLFWLGETYLKGADYKQAEKHYQDLIKIYPDSEYLPQAYNSLGWTYFEQKNYPDAVITFQKVASLFPNSPLREDARFKIAEAHFNQGLYEASIKHFRDFTSTFPQSPKQGQAYFYLGESYYYLEDFLVASTYYAKAAEVSTDQKLILMSKINLGWCYIKLKRFELAQKTLGEARGLADKSNELLDDVLLGQASLYNDLGDHKTANEFYAQLIEQFPNSPRLVEAYLGQANNSYLLQDYPSALTQYQQILDQFSSSPTRKELTEKAHFGLAWTYLKSGQLEQAIAHFQQIMDQSESKTVKVSALVQIADAYHDINNLEKAVEIYDHILKDYPDSPYVDYAQFRQGIVLMKQENVDAALISFKSLENNFPKSKYLNDTKYFLGVAYFKKDNWATAQEYIEKYLKNSQDSPMEFAAEANYVLALCAFNLNDPKRALKIFEQVVKTYPDEPAILRNSEKGIAECLYKIGDTKAAVEKFNSIIQTHPDSSIAQESMIWLGNYYMETADFPTAAQKFEEFLSRYPNSEKINEAHYQLGKIYENRREFEKALNQYKSVNAPEEDELYAKAKLAIADIFSRELDSQTAIQTYENIISRSPDFKRDAFVKIADVYKGQQEYQKAVETYQRALSAEQKSSQAGDPELQFQIADVCELAGQNDKALEEYLKIPYLYPDEKAWVIKANLRAARIFEDGERWEDAKNIYKKIVELNIEESAFANERLEWLNENTEQQHKTN